MTDRERATCEAGEKNGNPQVPDPPAPKGNSLRDSSDETTAYTNGDWVTQTNLESVFIKWNAPTAGLPQAWAAAGIWP